MADLRAPLTFHLQSEATDAPSPGCPLVPPASHWPSTSDLEAEESILLHAWANSVMIFVENRGLVRKQGHFSYYMRKHAHSAWLEKPHNDLKPAATATGSRVSQLRFVCITLVGRFLMGFHNLMKDLAIAIISRAFEVCSCDACGLLSYGYI